MHYRLGRALGMTPREVKLFHKMLQENAAAQPQPAVVAGIVEAGTLATISLIASALSVGFAIVASFFKPGVVRSAELRPQEKVGRTISDIRRYAPRDGFDSLQDVATIGSIVPMVFALREEIDGVTYGGIRINMPLLWSQVQVSGGNPLIRAILLASEGGIATGGVDPNGFAVGSSTLNAYNLGSDEANAEAARYSVYFSYDTGRITSADHVAGRSADLDPGNAENYGGDDVFAIRSIGNSWAADFCSTSKPSTGGQFGIYSLIGNNIAYRRNPVIKPRVQAQLVPKGDDGDAKVKCNIDEVATAQRAKDSAKFSTRSGITSFVVNGSPGNDGSSLDVGDSVIYTLFKSSDALTNFGRALNAGSWSIDVEVERVGGSGTTKVVYEASGYSTALRALAGTAESGDQSLADGIKWLNASDQIVSQPIITITPDPNPNSTKVTLSTKLKYDATGLTSAQKEDLLYSRFRLVFENSAVENNEEPSVYYRVNVDKGSSVDANADFGGQTFAYTGATPTYTINETKKTVSATFNKSSAHDEPSADAASVISGKQQQWDDAIVVGELYRIGSALAVCVSRSPENEVFQSEADFTPVIDGQNGTSVTAVFKVVEAGEVGPAIDDDDLEKDANAQNQPSRETATSGPHIFRCSVSTFTTGRPSRLVEVILKSTLGIRINGLCNFRESLTHSQTDNKACLAYKGDIVSRGSTLKPDIFVSGTISTSQERYSFFRIGYREAGTTDPYTQFSECFGARGITQQAIYNSYSIEFPYEADWEIRHVPLTGWEIREGVASGTLIVLDSRLSTAVTASAGGATLRASGTTVSRSRAFFALPAVSRLPTGSNKEIGIGYMDVEDYVDAWGKLAESFVYSEVSSSAEQGPEHEVAHINTIVENDVIPIYEGLAKCGLNIRPQGVFQQLGQISGYFNAGMEMRRLRNELTEGATHLLPDLALEFCTNPIYGSGQTVSDDQIDFDSFLDSANWCYERRYFYDAGFIGPQNVTQWIADTAANHLLLFYEINGKLVLKPAIPHAEDDYNDWNVPVPVKGIFGAAQMRNFSFSMFDEEERRPIQVSGKWRQERPSSSLNNPGVFPVEKEILIREAGIYGDDADNIEQIDLSDYATNEGHLIDAMKYRIRFRRISTHSITFDTTQDALLTPLEPGDYIQVPMDLSYYDEFRSGIVKDDGVMITPNTIDAGEYQVFAWNGQIDSEPEQVTLSVTESGMASPTGIIFAIKETNRELRTYRIENITPIERGGFKVEALDMPTDSNGRLLLSQNWGSDVSDDYWIIQK